MDRQENALASITTSSWNLQTMSRPLLYTYCLLYPYSTLLATGGHSTNDIAIYSLPTFDPVAVCENGHADWVIIIYDIGMLHVSGFWDVG